LRLTIERMRALVIAAGVLLIAALGVFLTIGKLRHSFKLRDLPQKLGLDIQQEANGWTYSHALGAHEHYKIHASKEVVYKDNRAELHGVLIELYSDDGKSVDRIVGDEFTYDKKAGTATAVGPVDITLMRPDPQQAEDVKEATPKDKKLAKNLAPVTAAHAGPNNEIHVKTSGLSFNQNTGVATTAERVDFSTAAAAQLAQRMTRSRASWCLTVTLSLRQGAMVSRWRFTRRTWNSRAIRKSAGCIRLLRIIAVARHRRPR